MINEKLKEFKELNNEYYKVKNFIDKNKTLLNDEEPLKKDLKLNLSFFIFISITVLLLYMLTFSYPFLGLVLALVSAVLFVFTLQSSYFLCILLYIMKSKEKIKIEINKKEKNLKKIKKEREDILKNISKQEIKELLISLNENHKSAFLEIDNDIELFIRKKNIYVLFENKKELLDDYYKNLNINSSLSSLLKKEGLIIKEFIDTYLFIYGDMEIKKLENVEKILFELENDESNKKKEKIDKFNRNIEVI